MSSHNFTNLFNNITDIINTTQNNPSSTSDSSLQNAGILLAIIMALVLVGVFLLVCCLSLDKLGQGRKIFPSPR